MNLEHPNLGEYDVNTRLPNPGNLVDVTLEDGKTMHNVQYRMETMSWHCVTGSFSSFKFDHPKVRSWKPSVNVFRSTECPACGGTPGACTAQGCTYFSSPVAEADVAQMFAPSEGMALGEMSLVAAGTGGKSTVNDLIPDEVALPGSLEFDLEAVSWAYGKLIQLGYDQRQLSMDDALMLDRLKLMVEHPGLG